MDEDIDNYAAAGADGIGVWEYKLTGRPDAEFASRLRDVGLKAGICGPAVPSILPDFFFAEPRDPKDRTAALSQAITRFAQFNPGAVLCVTGDPRPSATPKRERSSSVGCARQPVSRLTTG